MGHARGPFACSVLVSCIDVTQAQLKDMYHHGYDGPGICLDNCQTGAKGVLFHIAVYAPTLYLTCEHFIRSFSQWPVASVWPWHHFWPVWAWH